MKTWPPSFNTYLLLLCAVLLFGCESTGGGKKKKEATTIRFHLECPPDAAGRSRDVPIYRENPVTITVRSEFLISEADITKAEVVEDHGAFAIRFELTRHGKFVLDTTSIGSRGKRLAVFSLFGDARWLGVVNLDRRMSDGVMLLVPDATRAEADRIVRGLNNIAAELKKNPDF